MPPNIMDGGGVELPDQHVAASPSSWRGPPAAASGRDNGDDTDDDLDVLHLQSVEPDTTALSPPSGNGGVRDGSHRGDTRSHAVTRGAGARAASSDSSGSDSSDSSRVSAVGRRRDGVDIRAVDGNATAAPLERPPGSLNDMRMYSL